MTVDVSHVVIILSMLGFSTIEAATQYRHKVADSQPCPRNKYVYTYDNRTKGCLRCFQCQRGFQVQTKCSSYNDTICEPCPSGWYSDVRGSRCKPCSGCKSGEYVRRSCIAKRDTKCQKCPRDTYTLSANATRCLPCKRCRQHERVKTKCSGVRDTHCGDCRHGYFRESSTGICLRCSPCPAQLQHLVVPECRDKLGMHHSQICWPGQTRVQFSGLDKNYISYKYGMLELCNTLLSKCEKCITDDNSFPDITEEILEVEFEDYTYIRENIIFTTYLLGSVLLFVVFIISVSIFLRFMRCKICTNVFKLKRFGNSEAVNSNSVKSPESHDNGSAKLHDSFNTDFGMDRVSLIENEEDMLIQTNSDNQSILFDFAEEVCVESKSVKSPESHDSGSAELRHSFNTDFGINRVSLIENEEEMSIQTNRDGQSSLLDLSRSCGLD